MPRKADPRTVVVGVRLTKTEAAYLDSQRQHLTRSEWMRWLLMRHKKE